LDFSRWVPGGFGTGDAVIIADQILEIVDLKFGKGVAVNAEDNSQMRLYALGAWTEFALLYNIQTVKMTIVQPRLDSVSSEEITVVELLNWAEMYVKPRAARAMLGEGEFFAGEHCQFCRAKATCRARADANLELAKFDFKKSELLQDDEIGEVLRQADLLNRWVTNIFEYAYDMAVNQGKKWNGWKLVEGRSDRQYADENVVLLALKANGYTDDQIVKPKACLGITAMETLLGKKGFDQLIGNFIIKPPGKPVLVPIADKRQELNSLDSAKMDFADVEDLLG